MSNPVVYAYRTTEINGQRVKLPYELLPSQDAKPRPGNHAHLSRQFRQERRAWWVKWQSLGLKLPDPDTGKLEVFQGLNRLPADLDLIEENSQPMQLVLPGLTSSAAD